MVICWGARSIPKFSRFKSYKVSWFFSLIFFYETAIKLFFSGYPFIIFVLRYLWMLSSLYFQVDLKPLNLLHCKNIVSVTNRILKCPKYFYPMQLNLSTNIQGFRGIRQWSINCCTSTMMIHNSIFCRFKLVTETFGQSTKWTNPSKFNKDPKVLSQQIRKSYYKTLGTSIMNNPLFPSFLTNIEYIYLFQNR